MRTPVPELKAGDQILFDHFGGTDRPGKVVKVTRGALHIEWTAPASGITRVVKLSTRPRGAVTSYIEAEHKNIRLAQRKPEIAPIPFVKGDRGRAQEAK